MRKKLITALLFIIAFMLCTSPACCEKVIATATLKVTLRIPERPITETTPEGVHDGYTLARTSDTIYVTAS